MESIELYLFCFVVIAILFFVLIRLRKKGKSSLSNFEEKQKNKIPSPAGIVKDKASENNDDSLPTRNKSARVSKKKEQHQKNVVREDTAKEIHEDIPDQQALEERSNFNILKDDITEEQTSGFSKGHLLFSIPSQMVTQQIYTCVIRIGLDIPSLFHDLSVSSKPKITEIKVSELMKVELIDYTETGEQKGLYFEIIDKNSSVQFIDIDDSTEWQFKVKPLKAGKLPLLLRISIIKMVNGVERYRETVKEIITEVISAENHLQDKPGQNIPVDLNNATEDVLANRKTAVDKSLVELYHLLSEYETLIDLESDPKTKLKYEKEIEDIKTRIAYYKSEKLKLV